jgi:hypothetical protein
VIINLVGLTTGEFAVADAAADYHSGRCDVSAGRRLLVACSLVVAAFPISRAAPADRQQCRAAWPRRVIVCSPFRRLAQCLEKSAARDDGPMSALTW